MLNRFALKPLALRYEATFSDLLKALGKRCRVGSQVAVRLPLACRVLVFLPCPHASPVLRFGLTADEQ